MKLRSGAVGLCLGLAATSGSASAGVTFTAMDTQGRSASATFEQSGSTLTVLLLNTSLSDVMVPTDVLTGVFFDSATSLGSLTKVSAKLDIGSTVLFASQPTGGNVGGEWAWKGNLSSGAPASNGISSTGLGLFGPSDRFSTTQNLAGPSSVGGLEYGITSMMDNPLTGNTPVTGSNPLIKSGVKFTFGNLSEYFTLGDITNVYFQYGTSLSEPRIAAELEDGGSNIVIPVPASMWGGLLLMLGVGYWQRRRLA